MTPLTPEEQEQQLLDEAILGRIKREVPRAGGRRSSDGLGTFIGALSPTWQAAIVLGLAILAGAGAQSVIVAQRGLPARVAALEQASPRLVPIVARLDALERESLISRQMWRDVRYLVCRSREQDAGRTTRGCEYLYDETLSPSPVRQGTRADTTPVPDRRTYRETP